MDKTLLLKNIETLIQEGQLTKNELLEVFERTQRGNQEVLRKQSSISNILYGIGGAIVFLGICIFVGTNWSNLMDGTKILATLGSSVMIYVAAVLLSKYENFQKVADAFYFISGLVAPLGIFVTMDIAGLKIESAGSHSVIAGILLIVYLLSYYLDRRQVFLIFNIIFGTWLFFSLTTFLTGGRPFSNWDFIKYRWLAVGLSHIMLGYSFANTQRGSLTPALYGFGAVEFLTAALCLGGWKPDQSIFWELAFPGLAFGFLFLSVYLKTRSFLVFGTMYLMFYIIKITGEYFTSGFGWALSLIIVGFALIGIGYFAFYLNKKYISPTD